MWRLINFLLVLLCLLGRASPYLLAQTDIMSDKKLVTPDSCENPRYFNLLPVQFIAKDEDSSGNLILTGDFASPLMSGLVKFKLPSGQKDSFSIKKDDDWGEQIDRKRFLKKFKKGFWFVVYLASEENTICGAYQFKNWEALRSSFADDRDGATRAVDTLVLWERLRLRPLMFVEIKDNKAYWIFVSLVSGPRTENDEVKIVLKNGMIANKRLLGKDGVDGRIEDHGVYTLHKNTVFNTSEIESSKIKIGSYSLFSNFRVRAKLVDFNYFLEKSTTSIWFCFYDEKTNVIVRLIEMVP